MNEQQSSWILQGRDRIDVNAAPAKVWSILQDSQMLPEWMPAVISTNGLRETIGATRRCQVNFEGRAGEVVERCVMCEERRRIGWLVVEDSLGFSKMLKHFTFDFVLEPLGPEKTCVVNASYFEPRNLLARVMVALMIRRKFRTMRQRMLANMKRLAEESGV